MTPYNPEWDSWADTDPADTYFFTADGTYGSANSDVFVLLDTSNWVGDDWLAISECCDSDRLALAMEISRRTGTVTA